VAVPIKPEAEKAYSADSFVNKVRSVKEIQQEISEVESLIDTYNGYIKSEHVKLVLKMLNGQLKTLRWCIGLEERIGI
jgi:hypothetical protein